MLKCNEKIENVTMKDNRQQDKAKEGRLWNRDA
jgi:hypothetical protein